MKNRLALAMLLCGCSGAASAKLELVNETASAAAKPTLADGTALRLKIIAVYLSEDVDRVTKDNVGQTAMIWLNPECRGDIGGCNVEGMLPAGGPRVTEYFDLARPTDEVNAELNAQPAAVTPGTYRYARVELCKGLGGRTEPTAPTMMWRGPGMTEEHPFTSGDCGRTSLPFDPPLELADGDGVSVALGYDLSRAVVVGAPGTGQGCSAQLAGEPRCFRACVDVSPTVRACMDFPDFVPSAARVP